MLRSIEMNSYSCKMHSKGSITCYFLNGRSGDAPVIGMLHAPPLPGSPGYGGRVDSIRQMVLRDADALTQGGVDGLMIENFGDTPFFPVGYRQSPSPP